MTGGSIHLLFEDQVRHAPDRTAVITENVRLGYRELDAAANRLAAYLAAESGLPESGATVAICTDRLPDALVAMLAVLKAGHAYTVVGAGAPREEIRRLLGLAEAGAVITHQKLLARIDDGRRRAEICLDRDADAIAAHPDTVPARRPGSRRATVLFTAGTTGERRAVASGHDRWLAAFAAWTEVYGLVPEDRLLVTAGTETTEFTGGWIRALCSGGTLVLSERLVDGPLIESENVTVAETGPATAARLLERQLPSLRLLLVGGEPLRLDEQLRLQGLLPDPGARVVSVYGPAEVAGCGMWFEPGHLPGPVEHPERVAYLGRPFPGCTAELRKGRIWLTPPEGGDAVPAGDAGRRHGEGPLEFRGRIADRIAIGGRTVDTYRVESALGGHPDIGEVVVTGDRGRTGSKLIAYVSPGREGAVPDAASLRARLSGLVPAADIPETVVRVDPLPRNAAGKVDRTALPLPPVPGAKRYAGKGGVTGTEMSAAAKGCGVPVLAGVLAAVLTDTFWPGSTDLTGVPGPWSGLFGLLYVFEVVSFAAGVGFLVSGRGPMLRRGGPRGLTTAAHLALVWLLVAWWPQDNFYRLAAKQDWPRQAALVYAFNVPLMIAAGIVVAWAVLGVPSAHRDGESARRGE